VYARTVIIAAALLGLASVASAQSAVEVISAGLNVRATAGGAVIGRAQRGDQFVAREQQGSWLRIDFRGRRAWISGGYVRAVRGATVVRVDKPVNVRAAPSTNAAQLGVAGDGEMYVRLGGQGGWHLIQFDGRRGWVVGQASADPGRNPPPPPAPPANNNNGGGGGGGARNVTQAELEILARIVKGEALVCSFEGKVAVAAVVLNRVADRRWPNTIAGVAHQPWQFSCYNPSYRNRLYYGPIPQSCWDAARAAVAGQDPSRGAVYYFNPYLVRPSWARSLTFIRRIGTNASNTHDFYR
jgi:uncharacterized protein YraI